LNEDACSTVVITVEKYGDIVAGSADDLEDFYFSCALDRHLPFNRDCFAFPEGSQGGASGWIAVVGLQARLLRSCAPQANEHEACRSNRKKSKQCDGPRHPELDQIRERPSHRNGAIEKNFFRAIGAQIATGRASLMYGVDAVLSDYGEPVPDPRPTA
jgi:hypothetical protein